MKLRVLVECSICKEHLMFESGDRRVLTAPHVVVAYGVVYCPNCAWTWGINVKVPEDKLVFPYYQLCPN